MDVIEEAAPARRGGVHVVEISPAFDNIIDL